MALGFRPNVKSSTITGYSTTFIYSTSTSTSVLSVVLLVCLETVLLSTGSDCTKNFVVHWNTTNPMKVYIDLGDEEGKNNRKK
ncbi:hypothetical protein Phum_PHUM090120 [Pediculus humanus corporis]|uniref:Uncharacterized protein n=1 Tax=Pediculus humanus subsp. corporis TaxID=121224 RepID=E0VCL6_PEDHC|nr:uncharacterized protein Phum_PHUM090120 [Pediculus humanus corporis]EEB11122.1 hypothetical protein Phum_PHUM090120 [Pediculus humanus corporis]